MRKFGLSLAVLALMACQTGGDQGAGTTIYIADTVLTVDADMSAASAVQIKDGEIIAIGGAELVRANSAATINRDFENDVILPGLIDPHVHVTLGAMMYAQEKAPPWDVPMAGGIVPGAPDRDSFLARIAQIDNDRTDNDLLIIWGYHNLVHGDLTRADLDAIAPDAPLIIWHYSGHDWYLNSVAITQAGLTPDMAQQFHGVDLDGNGELTGRIYEDAALAMLGYLGPELLAPEKLAAGFAEFEALLAQGGVTTIAEMGYGIFGIEREDALIAALHSADDGYRLMMVPEHRAFSQAFAERAPEIVESMVNPDAAPGTPRVLPQVKFFTDGAYYSQTMKLRDPGYTGGQSAGTDGLWVTAPEELAATLMPYWSVGLDLHIHSNGDAAQDATLAALVALPPQEAGNPRTIIEHGGLIRPEHIAQMGEGEIGLSAASHYVMYMGDRYTDAIGERTAFITPLRSLADKGVPAALHSDAPLAPPSPLRAAGAHITRATISGEISTPSEQLTAEQALRTITIDAAWMLGLEGELGSIAPGKRADFTVLAQNPLTTPAEAWGQITVRARIVDGRVFPATPTDKTD